MARIKLDDDLMVKLRGKSKKECRSATNLANLLLRKLLKMKPTPSRLKGGGGA